jgi:hypothetical protein
MNIMTKKPFLYLSFILLAASAALPSLAQDDPRARLLARLGANPPSPLAAVMTPLLLDYVETVIPKGKSAELYAAADSADLLRRVRVLTGKDLLDLGQDMSEFFESKAPKTSPEAWTTFNSGPFLVHVRPGSTADRDREIISAQLATVIDRIGEALDLAAPFDAARKTLKPASPDAPGLIPIRLYDSRSGDAATRIKKGSTGSATLGATIENGAGLLTFDIHVLYFNALSLPVVEHEAAHAVVLLSTFDAAALTAKPLQGEPDLRKAFFAGYRKIPSFLQEGLGDWAFYYHGFHKAWGLLPPPEALVAGLRAEGKTLPLKELLAADARFAAKTRKIYSLQAASFIAHLIRNKGRDKVREWLFSAETDGSKTFEKTFGLKIAEAEKDWLAALR